MCRNKEINKNCVHLQYSGFQGCLCFWCICHQKGGSHGVTRQFEVGWACRVLYLTKFKNNSIIRDMGKTQSHKTKATVKNSRPKRNHLLGDTVATQTTLLTKTWFFVVRRFFYCYLKWSSLHKTKHET